MTTGDSPPYQQLGYLKAAVRVALDQLDAGLAELEAAQATLTRALAALETADQDDNADSGLIAKSSKVPARKREADRDSPGR